MHDRQLYNSLTPSERKDVFARGVRLLETRLTAPAASRLRANLRLAWAAHLLNISLTMLTVLVYALTGWNSLLNLITFQAASAYGITGMLVYKTVRP